MSERAKVEDRHRNLVGSVQVTVGGSRPPKKWIDDAAQLLADFEAEAERRVRERTCVWEWTRALDWKIGCFIVDNARSVLKRDTVLMFAHCPYCGGRIVTAPASEEE